MSADELNIQQYKKIDRDTHSKADPRSCRPYHFKYAHHQHLQLGRYLFVGQISTSASGAVGIVSSLMAIIQALGFTLGHGSGTIISRSLGSRNTDAATRFASTSFFTALAAGVVLAVVGLATLPSFMMLAGQHRDHSAPRLRLCTAHPHCSPAYDLQPCDEQHPAL